LEGILLRNEKVSQPSIEELLARQSLLLSTEDEGARDVQSIEAKAI
jgi:hypothetical protein